MNTITAGDIAMMTDRHNHGRQVHVDAPHPTHAGAWHVTSLQTVTLSRGGVDPISDYPAGTRFSTPGRLLRPFGGLDAAEEARDAAPMANVMAPRRQVEFSR